MDIETVTDFKVDQVFILPKRDYYIRITSIDEAGRVLVVSNHWRVPKLTNVDNLLKAYKRGDILLRDWETARTLYDEAR